MPLVLLSVAHLQQRRDGECLAVCAAMVLNYIGLQVPYKRLLKLLEIQSGLGAPSYNIRHLSLLGIRVSYERGTLNELRSHLQANQPCIAFVKTGELPYWQRATDHALVVVGMDDEYIYVNDPEFPVGTIQVAIGDFDLAWLERDEMYAVLAR
jgi:ABC-type bacteriocin/lantibiotic exporter with double-glycine peptidase domain